MKIFIQIASYRDPELLFTIKDCINNANKPNNLVFAIANQYHPDDKSYDLSEYENDKRFKILNIPYQESKGVCWARHKTQQLYRGEKYTLQIDSHMRFEKDWDKTLIDMVKDLQKKGIPKPLLTSYVSSYNPKNDPNGRVRVPWRMAFDKFIPEGAIFFLPETIPNWENLKEPVSSRFYSAHFCFTLGEFSKEVQHNPDFYFHGEEISIAVRAFTHGYDLFHPHKVVIWHEYTREGRTKQWDDDKMWYLKNDSSHLLNRQLFGMDGLEQIGHDGKYGFGNKRTLRDYEIYAGILFSKRGVQQQTLNKEYPPNDYTYDNDNDWVNSFSNTHKHCIKFNKNILVEDDYDFHAFIFSDNSGFEVYRKDIDKNELKVLLSNESEDHFTVCREFTSVVKPTKWILWPHSESKGWLDKMENKI